MAREVRLISRDVEFRTSEATQNGDGRTLEGHAAVFNVDTEINSWEGTFKERVAPGAFRKTIQERKPIVQYDHGKDARVGSTPIASIQELREDDDGLYVQARLFDNAVVDPVRQAIEGNAISGMSFRFQVTRDEWRDGGDKLVRPEDLGELIRNPGDRGPLQRTIREVQLFELGPVAFPAYESTSVSVRSMLDELGEEDRERLISELVEDAHRTATTEEELAAPAPPDAKPGGSDTSNAAYKVVADGGCGSGKFAVVDSKTNKTKSCHPDKGSADAQCQKMNAGGNSPMMKDGEPESEEHAAGTDAKTKPYGNVSYADPKNNKYPIDTAAHVKAAWSYINMPKNQSGYDSSELAAIKGRIKAAAKKFGITIGSDQQSNSKTPAPTTTVTPGTTRKGKVMSEELMTVEERAARQAEIRARLSEIDTEYNGAALPEETQSEWDELNSEYVDHDTAIESANERTEQLRRLAVDGGHRSTERAGDRRVPAMRRRPDNIYDLNEIRSTARSVDEISVLYRENAMRAVEQAKFAGGVRKEAAQERVENLLHNVDDENGTLARRILVTGSPLYERAWGKAVRALNTNSLTSEELRALSLGGNSGADGGYAVPFQLDPTVILDTSGVINPLRSMARQVQITGKQWQGVTTEGVTVSRSAEAAEVDDNSFSLDQPTVDATRVTGFVPFSVELESSWGAMRSEITAILADAKAAEEADSFVNGNGQSYAPFGVVATLDASSHVPDMSSFGSEDIYALEEALPPRYRARAEFLAAKSTYNAVRQFASGNDGSDLWVRLGAGTPNQLIGYNASESSEMDGVGSSDGYLLFGDFQHFLIVDRLGMSVELVPHLFGTQGRPTGQRGVLAIWANGSKILVDNAFRLLVNGTS